jgi:hypothetical protein
MSRAARLTAWIGLVSIACAVAAAADDVRRVQPERRPYIIEIGSPYEIDPAQLQYESGRISDLAEYLAEYGQPDYAEVQAIRPRWPWAAYEVRVYYLDRDVEVDLGHVFLSPAYTDFGMKKFQGTIEPAKRHQIERTLQARAAQGVPGVVPASAGESIDDVVRRAEAAAERAAQAAERAEADSRRAANAAERQSAIIDKMR